MARRIKRASTKHGTAAKKRKSVPKSKKEKQLHVKVEVHHKYK